MFLVIAVLLGSRTVLHCCHSWMISHKKFYDTTVVLFRRVLIKCSTIAVLLQSWTFPLQSWTVLLQSWTVPLQSWSVPPLLFIVDDFSQNVLPYCYYFSQEWSDKMFYYFWSSGAVSQYSAIVRLE